jgi:hypothetical protein
VVISSEQSASALQANQDRAINSEPLPSRLPSLSKVINASVGFIAGSVVAIFYACPSFFPGIQPYAPYITVVFVILGCFLMWDGIWATRNIDYHTLTVSFLSATLLVFGWWFTQNLFGSHPNPALLELLHKK